MLIAFFAFMAAQGAVWYSSFFYIQVFLEQSLGMAGASVNLVIMVMTIVSAPALRLLRLAERPRRAARK